jgi:ASC-1-like (ASCH) protein
MKNHRLPFQATDKQMFDDIKSGLKSIETRAGTVAYQKIVEGDTLTFTCGKDKLVKVVKEVRHYNSLDEMFNELDLKDIMPRVESIEEAKKIYYSFTGYRERLERDGVLAFSLGNV